MPRYFHGGISNLDVGDKVLPPAATGHPLPAVISASYDPRSVYVATNQWYASIFALPWPGRAMQRAVYEVKPIGVLKPDLEREGGYMCHSATVLRRVDLRLGVSILNALLRWQMDAERRFGRTEADMRRAAKQMPAPGVSPRLLWEFAKCLPGPGSVPFVLSADVYPELVGSD